MNDGSIDDQAFDGRIDESPTMLTDVHATRDVPKTADGDFDHETIIGHSDRGDSTPVDAAPPRAVGGTPQSIGPYQIDSILGRGGMGVVYKARQSGADRWVALKVIRDDLVDNAEVLRRFNAEARAAAKLDHPNLVTVYDVGQSGGYHYYSMRLVDGENIAERLRRGPISPRVTARYIRDAAKAIAAAHAAGVLHRDLKPGNLIVDATSDTALVADFGLAKLTIDESLKPDSRTRQGTVLGTIVYAPPEQLEDAAGVDARADVYAIGATMYHMVTGQRPFSRSTTTGLIEAVRNEEPAPVRSLVTTVPKDLETIIHRAMDKRPGMRFATMDDLVAELNRFLDGVPILSRPINRGERLMRWARRNPRVVAIGALAVALLVMAGLSLSIYRDRTRIAERRNRLEQIADAEHAFKSTLDRWSGDGDAFDQMAALIETADTWDADVAAGMRRDLATRYAVIVREQLSQPSVTSETLDRWDRQSGIVQTRIGGIDAVIEALDRRRSNYVGVWRWNVEDGDASAELPAAGSVIQTVRPGRQDYRMTLTFENWTKAVPIEMAIAAPIPDDWSKDDSVDAATPLQIVSSRVDPDIGLWVELTRVDPHDRTGVNPLVSDHPESAPAAIKRSRTAASAMSRAGVSAIGSGAYRLRIRHNDRVLAERFLDPSGDESSNLNIRLRREASVCNVTVGDAPPLIARHLEPIPEAWCGLRLSETTRCIAVAFDRAERYRETGPAKSNATEPNRNTATVDAAAIDAGTVDAGTVDAVIGDSPYASPEYAILDGHPERAVATLLRTATDRFDAGYHAGRYHLAAAYRFADQPQRYRETLDDLSVEDNKNGWVLMAMMDRLIGYLNAGDHAQVRHWDTAIRVAYQPDQLRGELALSDRRRVAEYFRSLDQLPMDVQMRRHRSILDHLQTGVVAAQDYLGDASSEHMARLALARQLIAFDQIDPGMREIQQVLFSPTIDPWTLSAAMRTWIGTLAATDRTDEAIDWLTRYTDATADDPVLMDAAGRAEWGIELAKLLAVDGRPDEAIQTINSAIELRQRSGYRVDTDTWLIQGFLHEAVGDDAAAKTAFGRAIETARRHAPPDSLSFSIALSLSETELERDTERMMATAQNRLNPMLANTLIKLAPRRFTHTVLRYMWRSPRGRAIARKIILGNADGDDIVWRQMQLVALEVWRMILYDTKGYQPRLRPDEDEMLHRATEILYAAYRDGEVAEDVLFGLVMAYLNPPSLTTLKDRLPKSAYDAIAVCYAGMMARRGNPTGAATLIGDIEDLDPTARPIARRVLEINGES